MTNKISSISQIENEIIICSALIARKLDTNQWNVLNQERKEATIALIVTSLDICQETAQNQKKKETTIVSIAIKQVICQEIVLNQEKKEEEMTGTMTMEENAETEVTCHPNRVTPAVSLDTFQEIVLKVDQAEETTETETEVQITEEEMEEAHVLIQVTMGDSQIAIQKMTTTEEVGTQEETTKTEAWEETQTNQEMYASNAKKKDTRVMNVSQVKK